LTVSTTVLLVIATGKYWRLDYRFLGRRRTLALGTCPDTSPAKARSRSSEARILLADGLDTEFLTPAH
jgi:hypothetical protein